LIYKINKDLDDIENDKVKTVEVVREIINELYLRKFIKVIKKDMKI